MPVRRSHSISPAGARAVPPATKPTSSPVFLKSARDEPCAQSAPLPNAARASASVPYGTGSKVILGPSLWILFFPGQVPMRRLVRPLLLTALAACCGTALAATTEQAPQGRLPGWAVPQSYRLAFKVDPAQQDFSGTTTIRVKLTRASDHLWLDGSELKVSKVTITDGAGKAHAGKYVEVDPKAGVVRVDFGRTLKPQELTLKLDYTAPLNAQLQGLYKVRGQGSAVCDDADGADQRALRVSGFRRAGLQDPVRHQPDHPDRRGRRGQYAAGEGSPRRQGLENADVRADAAAADLPGRFRRRPVDASRRHRTSRRMRIAPGRCRCAALPRRARRSACSTC